MSQNAHSRLLLYVDPSWQRTANYSVLLYPFWGNPLSDASLFAKEAFDFYPLDTSVYGITGDLSEAHMVLPPYRHQWLIQNDLALLDECARVAKEAGLPLLIDGVGDVEFPIGIENVYVLRIGGYRFIPEQGRVSIPPFVDDLLERCANRVLQVRHKKEGAKPVVGFAGWARLSTQQRLRTFAKEIPSRIRSLVDRRYGAYIKGVWWREWTVAILQKSDAVTCNFLLRTSFSGSAKTAVGDLRQLRQEFVDNLLASDYGLCIKGDANASNRLFETLSLGRIPVLLDTECILPFSDTVDYKSFCLMVDFRDIKKLPQKIAGHYALLSDEQFIEMQKAARNAFVNYFRTDVLIPHIIKQLAIIGAIRQ